MNEKSPQDRQLLLMRLQTVMIALILILILGFVLFLAGKVTQVMGIVQQIDMVQVNGAVASLKSAADQLSQVDVETLNEGIQGISDAAGELSELDFQQLSGFLTSLEDLSKEIDGVSGLLKGLFRR